MSRKSASPVTSAAPATAAAPAAPAAISKSQAMRNAIAAGHETAETALPWIWETYGLKMTPQLFSSIKSSDKRRGIGGNSMDALSAMEALKPIVLSHGVEKVKRMTELCG